MVNNAPSKYSDILYCSEQMAIGHFHLPGNSKDFAHAGEIRGPTFVFPRTQLWIEKQRQKPYLSHPNLFSFYNGQQPFVRYQTHDTDDICDWFEFSKDVVNQALNSYLAKDSEGQGNDLMERIAEIDHAFCKPALFSKQRLLINGLKSGKFPVAAITIRSFELLQDIISALLGQQCNSKISRQTRFRYHDIVAKTEEQLLQNLPDTLCLDALAKEIGVSPFHLCRVFKLINGVSILDFVLQVRLRFSLEALSLDQDIAQVATDHGFSSHSHYSTRFKRVFGCTPNAYRQTLSTVE